MYRAHLLTAPVLWVTIVLAVNLGGKEAAGPRACGLGPVFLGR